MSRGVSRWTRIVQAAALIVVYAVLIVVTHVVSDARGVVGAVAGLGFLLLAGTLTSELGETVGVPHLSSYIATGFLAGPSVLGLVDHDTIAHLSSVDTLALALIALAGGCELRIEILKRSVRSLTWATIFQTAIPFAVCAGSFLLLSRFIPFMAELSFGGAIGVSILWASISITRSPSALLGILAQTRARGPLTTFSLAFVMLSDVVVILVAAVAVVFARPLLDPASGLSLQDIAAFGHEVVGSVALGVSLGIVLILYLRLVGEQLLVVLIGLGLGLSELLRYIEFDALLAFIVAGFVVENFSKQGEKLLESVSRMSTVVFVIFFALAGAHLDLGLLRQLGPVAAALCLARAAATFGAGRVSARVAADPVVVRSWGWSAMISQAGVTLGLASVMVRSFPAIGSDFMGLAVAAMSINQIVGPVLFKMGLDKSRESATSEGPGRFPDPHGAGTH